MAFDVYVGGLSRFYSGEWENVAQKYARENGIEYHVIQPGGPSERAEWEAVAEAVVIWRDMISRGLGSNIPSPLDWNESRGAPYFTDRPGYDGYGALVVWAAHAALGTIPPKDYSGEWYEDDAVVKCLDSNQGQMFCSIINSSLWLPGSFDFRFTIDDLTGEKVDIASNMSLQRSLQELNAQTFNMSGGEMNEARMGGFGDDPPLDSLARFGLSMFHDLSMKSIQHQLPILLSF